MHCANKGGEWGERVGTERSRSQALPSGSSVFKGVDHRNSGWLSAGAKQRGLLTRGTCKQAPGEGVGSGRLVDPVGSQRSSRNSSEAKRRVVCFCLGKASKMFPGSSQENRVIGRGSAKGSPVEHKKLCVRGSDAEPQPENCL